MTLIGFVVRIILILLALLAFIGSLINVGRALGARSAVERQFYSVAQQEARRAMNMAWVRAGILFVLALALVIMGQMVGWVEGWFGEEMVAVPTVTATAEPMVTPTLEVTLTLEPTATPLATATATVVAPPATPTNPAVATEVVAPTATAVLSTTATLSPTEGTPTIAEGTAVVNSPIVGLYLRNAPGGQEIIELLPDQAVVTLLEGQAEANGFVWQQVQSSNGNQGWVALDYLELGTGGN
ncbi:MAG TPA: SH3 domain-containing protein [Anaerolineae bacterium]|nr:SH3 domain-containing protein [Anaerolineae bacterium]